MQAPWRNKDGAMARFGKGELEAGIFNTCTLVPSPANSRSTRYEGGEGPVPGP